MHSASAASASSPASVGRGAGFGEQIESSHAHDRIGAQADPQARREQRAERRGTVPVRAVGERAVGDGRARPCQEADVAGRHLDEVNAERALAEDAVALEPFDGGRAER